VAVNGVALDTNAYAAFKRGEEEAVEILTRAPFVCLSTVVLGELLAGFSAGTRKQANLDELEQFLGSEPVVVLPVDQDTSRYYASVYRALRRKGRPIPTNDMWTAASAIQHGMSLFSYDEHFQHVDHLAWGHTLSSLGL